MRSGCRGGDPSNRWIMVARWQRNWGAILPEMGLLSSVDCRGVDAVTHEAVLRAGGRTLAVLGSGVDVIYPPEYENGRENH